MSWWLLNPWGKQAVNLPAVRCVGRAPRDQLAGIADRSKHLPLGTVCCRMQIKQRASLLRIIS